MYFCYIDESGDTTPLSSPTVNIQPVIAIGGVIVDSSAVHDLTLDLIRLKQRFFPALMPAGSPLLDWILGEVKGVDVRRSIASNNHRERRGAVGFLDKIVDLLERHNIRLIGRVWIKGIGTPIDGNALYTSSIQAICSDFQHFLGTQNDSGLVIADSRSKAQNTKVAHSIFTWKFKAKGDGYDRILEMPTFGHSDNHAGIQIADMLCSGLLVPMAIDGYCAGQIANVHVRSGYSVTRPRWGERLKSLQHQYQDASGRGRGGFVVSDGLTQRHSGYLFHQ